MRESRTGSATPWGRVVVVAIIAAVALAGTGAFAIGGSSAMYAGGPADWSPDPGKEVTPECPPANETTSDDASNETGNETDESGYQLVINYTGAWQGTIITNDTNIPIEGTGDETIDIEADEDERVAATVSKANVTGETMGVTLLLNGLVIDEQKPVEPTVDNFDDNDDGASTADDDQADSMSSDPAFASTSSDPSSGTETDDDWETFGEENEASSFEDSAVAAEDDPFDDSNDTETTNTTDSAFAAEDSDTIANDTDDTDEANETNDTEAGNATAAEECVTAENTTTATNDTNDTNDTALAIETDEEAQVVIADQNLTGSSVVVESATVPDSGFVVIHNMSMMEGESVEKSVVGVSEKLDAQQSEDIEVTLADDIDESQTLVAVVYRDSNDDGEFEFGESGEVIDEPYRDDEGSAVADDAFVTVPGDEDTVSASDETTTATTGAQDTSVFTETATPTETATADDAATTATQTSSEAMSGNAAERSTETNAPGFGIGVAVVTILGSALLATRRF